MSTPFLNKQKFRYLEWNDAEDIHDVTVLWKSQLEFVATEQAFLSELLSEHTLQLLSHNGYEQTKHIAAQLDDHMDKLPELRKQLEEHFNKVIILLDGKDELKKERAFQDVHLSLAITMEDYFDSFRSLKQEVFNVMKKVFANSKQKRIS